MNEELKHTSKQALATAMELRKQMTAVSSAYRKEVARGSSVRIQIDALDEIIAELKFYMK